MIDTEINLNLETFRFLLDRGITILPTITPRKLLLDKPTLPTSITMINIPKNHLLNGKDNHPLI